MIDTDKNVADAHTTLGKLYVNDISDYRGERLRTPLEYTKWAVEQPEFGACQASRVVEEVFGRDATSEDREAIADVFESAKKFRPMMREALRRYVQRKLAGSVAPTAPAAEPTFLAARPTNTAATPDAMIAVMPQVRALLERHCLDCHDDADSDPNRNLDMPSLSRERMMLMLGYVGDRRMPKTTAGLSPAERKQLLEALVSNVWQADGDRLAAFRFYDEGLISSTVQLPDAALSLVYQRSGAVPKTPTSPMIEVTLPAKEVQYTPGFAAQMAFEALRACKAAHAEDLAACVERATDIENMVRP
jgi:mono/diheme cytochrome c family protein